MRRTVLYALALLGLPVAAQQPMTLRQCIDYAVARNVQVRQYETARKSREVSLDDARKARLPEVSGYASQQFNFGRGLTADNTYVSRNTSSTGFGVNASLPLFTGFRLPARKEQARLDLEAATADLQRVREDLGIRVTEAYMQVLYRQELQMQAREQCELSRSQLNRVEKLFAVQKVSGLEVSEARSRVAQDELSLTEADNARRLALLDLSQLIEMPSPDSLSVVSPSADEVPVSVAGSPQQIYEQAVGVRPSVRALRLRAESARKGIDIARSGYWPTLSLGAGLGSSFYSTSGMDHHPFGRQMKDNFNRSISLSLNVPLFNRFQTRNAVRQARLEHENSLWQQEQVCKDLYKEIQQAWYNAVAAERKYEQSGVAEAVADEAFRLMEKKYENGKAGSTEYDEARIKRLNAVYGRIAARYEYLFRARILDFYRGRPIN